MAADVEEDDLSFFNPEGQIDAVQAGQAGPIEPFQLALERMQPQMLERVNFEILKDLREPFPTGPKNDRKSMVKGQ